MAAVRLANGALSTDLIPGAPAFHWYEFSGVEKANVDELARLQLIAATILQKVRDALGPVIVSAGGWLYSRWGFRRDRAHGQGAAVDFNVQGRSTFDVWAWIGHNLTTPVPRYGECIEERNHVHVTLYGFGGRGEFLREPTEGIYVAYDPRNPGEPGKPSAYIGEDGPIEIPGITVTVARFPGGVWWGLGLGLAVLRAVIDHKKKRRRYA